MYTDVVLALSCRLRLQSTRNRAAIQKRKINDFICVLKIIFAHLWGLLLELYEL